MMKEIGRYQIRGMVGQGAMADVYEAYDPKIDRHLAIKMLRKDRGVDSRYILRLMREAKAVGSLHHPNIVSIFDVGEFDKRPYIVMELLKGTPLSDVVDKGKKFPVNVVISMGSQLASALDYAHERGIVHRDVKPSNIVVSTKDYSVKITDFGIAHFDEMDATIQTRHGDILGTPQYMSPEQVRGEKIDGRSDLFSLGVILYQMLTGEKPFSGDSITTLMYKITTAEPEPITKLSRDVPKPIRQIVHKLLEKKPINRYQTGKELVDAFRVALKKVKKSNSGSTNAVADTMFSKPVAIAAAAVAGIALAAGLVFVNPFSGNDPSQSQFVDTQQKVAEGKIYGMVVNGQVKNTKVSVFDFEETINRGSNSRDIRELVSAESNESGVFILPLKISARPLLVVAQENNLGSVNVLSAVINYHPDKETGVNITLFTHMAVGLAINYANNGFAYNDAINEANASISDFLGIEDLLVTKARTLAANDKNLDEELQYGFLHTAMARMLSKFIPSNNEIQNFFAFAQTVHNDVVFDAKLDGKSITGPVKYVGNKITSNTYRKTLARYVGRTSNGNRSKSIKKAVKNQSKLVASGNIAILGDNVDSDSIRMAAQDINTRQGRQDRERENTFNSTDSRSNGGDSSEKQSLDDDISQRLLAMLEKEAKSLSFSSDSDTRQKPKQSVRPTNQSAKSTPDNTARPLRANSKPVETKVVSSIAINSVSGVANVGGKLKEARIKVYEFSRNGSLGSLLANGTTDSEGRFDLELRESVSQPMFIAAYGGNYSELTSGRKIKIKPKQVVVSAVVNSLGDINRTVNLTYYSHMAAAIANYRMRTGTEPEEAVNNANARVQRMIGFRFIRTTPATVFSESMHNGLITPELAYGMFNAAISDLTLELSYQQKMEAHTKITSAAFAKLSYDDLHHDGIFNGQSGKKDLRFFSLDVTAELYRRHLAQALLEVARGPINNTGLVFAQFLAIASQYNESRDSIFNKEPVIPISSDGPLITKFLPSKETVLSGFVDLSAKVNDITGIRRTTFWLDRTYLGDADNPQSPVIKFNSKLFPSGLHKVIVKAENKEGKESNLVHHVYIQNSAPKQKKAVN